MAFLNPFYFIPIFLISMSIYSKTIPPQQELINIFSISNGQKVQTTITSDQYFKIMQEMYRLSAANEFSQKTKTPIENKPSQQKQNFWGYSIGYELSIPLVFKYSHDIGILFNFK
jgi:hypothetical protein